MTLWRVLVFLFQCFRTLALVAMMGLCGCSPNSSLEFKREGEVQCRLFARDLKKIENRQQLLAAEPQIKKHFESLIHLMIQARAFQQKHPDAPATELPYEGERSMTAGLEEELRRIYAIEGGREVVERAQREALVRLDAYERILAKKREQLITY
jgi:hypothetical protein